ncbi:cytochrome c oxidase subunit 3 [Hwanghaeella grinnelliae]|uniref:Cytochrome c oxidase subunit 3 n=1 Tax=Hwanghaeella grinnelliae TaxID=2500179 RepID=A0A3S2W829_9PROT|nr:cytochrome c oxidase subunit 3 [Hwanghaeella grinnelliae]RVU35059.1 cytochrome c oxidase subunit 3 [Hwanghaeella grinnelliae]
MSAAEHHAPNHDYHLVDPSPWPALGALSGFVLAFGAVAYMHPDVVGAEELGPWTIIPGFLMVLFTMFVWWKDVIKEAHHGDHKPVVQLGLRYGMSLFIASEVMFFVAFFWAYFDASLFTDQEILFARVEHTGGVWPPAGVETFDPFDLPFMNTLILLLSGCTVTWAHHALREGKRQQVIHGLALTVILGFLFSSLQAYEYSHAAFGFTDGIYSSTFYMATGFHGFHVLVGTIFLAVCLVRATKGDFTPSQHFGFEAAAWYWHFVDVVWLFLFVCVYWWGS